MSLGERALRSRHFVLLAPAIPELADAGFMEMSACVDTALKGLKDLHS